MTIRTVIRLAYRLNFKWFPQQTANNPSLCFHRMYEKHHYLGEQYNHAIYVTVIAQISITHYVILPSLS